MSSMDTMTVMGMTLFALVSSDAVVIHPYGQRMCEKLAKVKGYSFSTVQRLNTDDIARHNQAVYHSHDLSCLLSDPEMNDNSDGQGQKVDEAFSVDTYTCFNRSGPSLDNVQMRRVMCTEFPATLMCEVVCQRVHVHTVCAFISGNRSCVFTTKQTQRRAVEEQSRNHHGYCTKGSDSPRKERQMKCVMVSRLPTKTGMKTHPRDSFHVDSQTISQYTSLRYTGKSRGYIRKVGGRCQFRKEGNYLNDESSVNCGRFGEMPLEDAVKSDSSESFDYFLGLGSQLKLTGRSRSKYIGRDLLHQASCYCRPHMVKTLVDLGFDVERRMKYNMTPILMAANNGCFDVVVYLYNIGCNITAVDEEKRSILHHAVTGNNVSLVRFILDLEVGRAMLELTNVQQLTAFLEAVDFKRFKIMTLLVKRGCNVSARGDFGQTALHLASRGGVLSIVQYIVSLNVLDISCKDMYGKTPLDIVSDRGYTHIVAYLKKQAKM